MTRWRGVVDLLPDAIHHGTLGVEGVHQRVARTPFALAARLPPLAPAARRLGDAQASIIAATYATIREVNAVLAPVVGAIVEVAVGARAREAQDGHRPASTGERDESGAGAASRPPDR